MANKSRAYVLYPAAPGAPVTSVFGRIGAVVAAVGDYAFAQISGAIDDAQHGNRAGGALHAVATAALAGFMSAADKSKLDGITPGAAVTSVFGRVGAVVAAVGDYAFAQISGAIDDAQHGNRAGGALHAAATAALAGFMSAADKSKLDGVSTSSGTAILHWGSNAISSTTTTRYLFPGYDSALASLAPVQYRAPMACRIRNMRVRHNTPAGNGALVVYTLRINGVASALTVSIASTANDASDLANTVAVAAGDLLDIEITKAASIGITPNDIMLSVEVIAP